jgi:RNase P subunit RPR2
VVHPSYEVTLVPIKAKGIPVPFDPIVTMLSPSERELFCTRCKHILAKYRANGVRFENENAVVRTANADLEITCSCGMRYEVTVRQQLPEADCTR